MINETQYRKLVSEYNRTKEITMSSIKAGMDRNRFEVHKGWEEPVREDQAARLEYAY